MLLKNKVAVITGGAGQNGLGFATARMMADQGATVVILDLAVADPQAAAARLGQQHLGLVANVTDKSTCEAAAAQIKAQYGRIDILVNNAGITQPAKFLDITGADYERILDVSLRGTLYASQAVLPTMVANGGGHIVVTASMAGLSGMPGDIAYTATKHAVVGLVKSLGASVDAYGVCVSAICPGFVDTPLVPADAQAFIKEMGMPVIPPSQVAETAMQAMAARVNGSQWMVWGDTIRMIEQPDFGIS